MSTNPTTNVGIIGFGDMGKRHALEYHDATQGKMNFVAVVEPETASYNKGCEWLGNTSFKPTNLDIVLNWDNYNNLM